MIEELKELLNAYEYHIAQTRPIERSTIALSGFRDAILEIESAKPVGYVFDAPDLTYSVIREKGHYGDHEAPLYRTPVPKKAHEALL